MRYVLGLLIYLIVFIINVFIPICISSAVLFIFDFAFGTTYLVPSYIGGLALLIWLTGRINK